MTGGGRLTWMQPPTPMKQRDGPSYSPGLGVLCRDHGRRGRTAIDPGRPGGEGRGGRAAPLHRQPRAPDPARSSNSHRASGPRWLRQQLLLEAGGMTGACRSSKWCKFEGNARASPGQGKRLRSCRNGSRATAPRRVLRDRGSSVKPANGSTPCCPASKTAGSARVRSNLGGQADLGRHGHAERAPVLPRVQRGRAGPAFLLNYHRWLNAQPGESFGNGYWPKLRFGDNIETATALPNRTGEASSWSC